MIKNIIFDLSEVIISGYHGVENIVEKNTNVTAEEFLKRKKETIDMFLDTMRGKHTEQQYLKKLIEGTNWDIKLRDLKKFIRENLNIPVKGTIEIIEKLKDKYNLVLLSDHVQEWMEYINKNNNKIDIFKHKYLSFEYGNLKSDKGSFKYVMEDLHMNPDETIFIDDYKSNVDIALSYGIDGIQFKNAEDLKIELNRRGIFLI